MLAIRLEREGPAGEKAPNREIGRLGEPRRCVRDRSRTATTARECARHRGSAHAPSCGAHRRRRGGPPFYRTYPCADGRHIAIGSLEPQFFAVSVARLGLEEGALGDPWKPENWPAWRAAIGAAFASRPRDEWTSSVCGFRRLRDAGAQPRGGAASPSQCRARRSWAGSRPSGAPAGAPKTGDSICGRVWPETVGRVSGP